MLKHDDLVERALALIENYNNYNGVEIEFTFSWNLNKCREWGYLLDVDIDRLDNYFIGILGMRAITKASWDNETAQKYYFYED